LEFRLNQFLFLSEQVLSHKNIRDTYGEYPYLNKNFDNDKLRYHWIENQRDNGIYYYQLLLKTVCNLCY
jgi:hypothetical protein